MTYVFAEFELDPDRAELRRSGEAVHIEPQVFDLLRLLVSQPDRIVSKDEIFHEIWGSRIVSDAALSSRIKDARRAIGDDGASQRFIRTVQRRGLMFVGKVNKTEASSDSPPRAHATEQSPQATAELFSRPAVAVLPFEAIGDTDAVSIAHGVESELVAALTAWRYFPVISTNSTRRFKNTSEAAGEIGRALNARYIVGGTYRETNDRLRVHVALTDAETDTQIWSDRIVCDRSELIDVEEELAARIATTIAPELENAEARRVVRKSPDDMDAWELAMRAAWLIERRTASELIAAEKLAERARDKAPDWVLPYTLIAVSRFQQAMTGFSVADSSQAFAPTLEAAQTAMEIDPNAWIAHALSAVGELWTNRNHERALLHVERAISLNPSAPMNYHFGGCIVGFSGDPHMARVHQERLFRVDPLYHHRSVIEADLGLWHLLEGDFESAEERLDRATAWNPNYGRAWQRQIALAGLSGNYEKAQQAVSRLEDLKLPLNADVIAASYPFREKHHSEMFLAGLKSSGVDWPEP